MKPAPFAYHRATSLADAIEALAASDGEGKLIAGGQSLVPLLSMRLAQPSVLVDLNGVDELNTETDLDDGHVRFGAMTRHARLVDQRRHLLAAEMAGWIGHTAIRSRGTLGGSIAHADPNAEWPALTLACDATVHVQGPAGPRRIAVGALFDGMLQTTIADDEILTAIDLGRPRRWGFSELARRHGDFALVLSVVTELESGWRVVLGGVAPIPIRVTEAEAALAAGAGTHDVGRLVEATIETYDDLHASARYRRAMAGELSRRAVDRARAMRTEGDPT